MRAAIQFDDEPCLEACEIRDIGSDRLLAAEFESGKPPVAQNKPQPAFGVRPSTAQNSGECVAGPFYGGGLPADFWNEELKGLLKAELARKNMKYPDLVKRLGEIGIKENEANLRNKISRGNFSAIFLLQCLVAIGASEVRIPRFPYAPGHDPDESLVRKWEQENR